MKFSVDSFLKHLNQRDKHYEVRITTTTTHVYMLDAKSQQEALEKIRERPSFFMTDQFSEENQTIITEWEDLNHDRN